MMYDILSKRNSGLKRQTLAFAQQLVSTAGYSGQETDVANLVLQQMHQLGYDRTLQDDFGNIVGILEGREAEPTVLLTCHMDTVSAGDPKAWQKDPFGGQISDGRLWGCGASDCKGGLAAQVFAAALLKRSLLPLRGNLVVAVTTCEEAGASAGMRHLLEATLPALKLTPTYAILGEPTDLGLYYGHDGWMEVNIDVQGSSLFEVDDAARNIFDQFRLFADEDTKTGGLLNLSAQAPVFLSNNPLRQARIRLNRRLIDHEQVESVMGQVKQQALQAVHQNDNVTVSVAVSSQAQTSYTGVTTVGRHITHAWNTDPFGVLMERSRQALEAAGVRVRPGKWQLGRIGMATAGGVLTKEYSIPTIGYGPGNEDVIHAPNEFVEVDKISEAVYGTASIVHSLIGVPVFGWTSDSI
jgi:acetylornithine deacetylase/succinyl-diaminopimelate desuccinylase-like protein